jgi:phosphoserine phosphatase
MSNPTGLTLRGVTLPLRLADFKLIAFDMDSTLINIECVDEIADAAGRKPEVAAITEAAMRGEITDYKDSLRRRVALLRGVTVAHMEQVYTERLQLNPGAEALVNACNTVGMKVLLVSGGFTFFTDRIRDRLGITVLLVEHHMSLVMSVSDKVVALNFGRRIAEGTPAEIQRHPDVIAAYLGAPADA